MHTDAAASIPRPSTPRLFRFLLDLEVARAARLRYYVSLVCVAPAGPGDAADAAVAEQIARAALQRLRRTDLATTFPDGVVALLLVDAEPREIAVILDRVSGAEQPGVWRFTVGRGAVSVSAGASCYPVTATSGRELLQEATTLLLRARAQGGSRLVLPPLLSSA